MTTDNFHSPSNGVSAVALDAAPKVKTTQAPTMMTSRTERLSMWLFVPASVVTATTLSMMLRYK